jgi:hypothetical protein
MKDAVFDITSEAVDETTTIHLKSAKGELLYANGDREKPCQIEIWGPGSDAYGVVESRQTARSLKRMQENDGKVTAAPFEERVRDTAEDLATLTRKFINFGYPKAGDVEGAELFAAVYRDKSLGFITKQVTQAVGDWGKFSGGSATS